MSSLFHAPAVLIATATVWGCIVLTFWDCTETAENAMVSPGEFSDSRRQVA